MRKLSTTIGVLLCLVLSFVSLGQSIKQNSTGDIVISSTYDNPQHYVEVFVRQNGIQKVATNIKASELPLTGGGYQYSYVMPAAQVMDGDVLQYRFYSFEPGKPGVFKPGPAEGDWVGPFIVGSEDGAPVCGFLEDNPNGSISVSMDGVNVKFVIFFPVKQTYVELFATKNGQQNIAQNITTTEQLVNNKYVYSHTASGNQYQNGDVVFARTYSYRSGVPGQTFMPGPNPSVWTSTPLVYQANCGGSAQAVYVSIDGDDANEGTVHSPLATISAAIDLAGQIGAGEVRIAAGHYIEGDIVLGNGIDLLGGYSSDFTQRDLTFTDHITIVDANAPSGFFVCGDIRVLVALNITEETIVEGLYITGGRVCPSFSGIAGGNVLIIDCDEHLVLRNNQIIGGSVVSNSPYSVGGNVFLLRSSCKLFNNIITDGFAPLGGADLYVATDNNGVQAEIAFNTFSSDGFYSVQFFSSANFHDNIFLNKKRITESDYGDGKVEVLTITGNVFNYTQVQRDVKVYSVDGRIVASLSQVQQFDLGHLPTGLYVVATFDGVNAAYNKHFVR